MAACDTLAAHGYEPHREDDTITLANCPFDALARTHTKLVCGMNLAVLNAVAERVGGGRLEAHLDPAPPTAAALCSPPVDVRRLLSSQPEPAS